MHERIPLEKAAAATTLPKFAPSLVDKSSAYLGNRGAFGPVGRAKFSRKEFHAAGGATRLRTFSAPPVADRCPP